MAKTRNRITAPPLPIGDSWLPVISTAQQKALQRLDVIGLTLTPLRRVDISGTRYAAWVARMASAARSPMITQGAIVLPVVTRGMIDPSAMRRFSIP